MTIALRNKISLLGFLTAIATAACGEAVDPGEDGSSGGSDPTVSTTSDTTPIPLTCSYEGAEYESGDEIASADGCVTFRCDEGALTMLEDSYTVVDGDLELASQADVDALECLREVGGTLTITGTTSDISTLNQLYRVGGSLEIRASALVTCNGIGGLGEIGGGLVIADNASLTTLAFAPYMSVFGDATIQNNDVLASLSGAEFLGACTTCSHAPPSGALAGGEESTGGGDGTAGEVDSGNEPASGDDGSFTAGDEAPQGGTFYGNILIADNDVLVDIDALGNLWYAWADVRLRGNLALADITAMNQLAEVRGALEISGHPAMDDATVQAFALAVDVWGARIVCGNGAGAAC